MGGLGGIDSIGQPSRTGRPISATVGPMDRDAAPSKGERKRAAAAKRALAERLLAIGPARRAKLSLDGEILEEIASVERARGYRARSRQISHLAKLLRRRDTTDLEAQLAALDSGNARALRAQHEAEHWRERLMASPADIDAFIAEHRGIQRSRLRALVRAAKRPDEGGAPDAVNAFRALYRELLAAINDGGE